MGFTVNVREHALCLLEAGQSLRFAGWPSHSFRTGGTKKHSILRVPPMRKEGYIIVAYLDV